MREWTKKDKVACITIFTLAILITITFVSSMTLSFLFDTHSVSDAITAGKVELEFSGANTNGQIKFPTVVEPNTTYYSTSSTDYSFKIKNISTSGAIYVYVCVELNDYISPVLSANWLQSTTEGKRNYYFYNKSVDAGSTIVFCDVFRTLNFKNANAGESVSLTLTVGAVQTQGGACKELINSQVAGWAYAPADFITIVS